MALGDIGATPEDVEKVRTNSLDKLQISAYTPSTYKLFCFSERHGTAVSTMLIRMTMSSINNLLVILLEEADVFLEQRRMFDIERNALITGKPTITTASLLGSTARQHRLI